MRIKTRCLFDAKSRHDDGRDTAGVGISDLVGHESRKTQIKIRKRRGNVKSRSTCQRGEKSDSKDTLRADPVDCSA